MSCMCKWCQSSQFISRSWLRFDSLTQHFRDLFPSHIHLYYPAGTEKNALSLNQRKFSTKVPKIFIFHCSKSTCLDQEVRVARKIRHRPVITRAYYVIIKRVLFFFNELSRQLLRDLVITHHASRIHEYLVFCNEVNKKIQFPHASHEGTQGEKRYSSTHS